MNTTWIALAGFAGWQLLLTIALVSFRTVLVLAGSKAANAFLPDGSNTPGFGQRLTRARDNCHENLPAFAALAIVAGASGQLAVTDPLAMWVLYARLGQSVTHMISTSVPAVFVRVGFFSVQIGILGYWAISLIA